MTKNSQEDQVKMFVERLFSSKPEEFFLNGIKKLPGKWQEVIWNNGEYIIDWY